MRPNPYRVFFYGHNSMIADKSRCYFAYSAADAVTQHNLNLDGAQEKIEIGARKVEPCPGCIDCQPEGERKGFYDQLAEGTYKLRAEAAEQAVRDLSEQLNTRRKLSDDFETRAMNAEKRFSDLYRSFNTLHADCVMGDEALALKERVERAEAREKDESRQAFARIAELETKLVKTEKMLDLAHEVARRDREKRNARIAELEGHLVDARANNDRQAQRIREAVRIEEVLMRERREWQERAEKAERGRAPAEWWLARTEREVAEAVAEAKTVKIPSSWRMILRCEKCGVQRDVKAGEEALLPCACHYQSPPSEQKP